MRASVAQTQRRQWLVGVGTDQESGLDAVDRDRATGLAGARPVFAAGRRLELPVPSEDLAVAADDEEAVEQFPGQGLAFWMADETGDSQVGAQTGEAAHPAIRLLGDPVCSDQRLEAIARHDQLTREHPVSA